MSRAYRCCTTVATSLSLTIAATAGEIDGPAVSFESPAGVVESCIAVPGVPGGIYSEQDHAAEAALCDIDFYSGDTGLCPKIFSTSAGTLVYDLSIGRYSGKADEFEEVHCESTHIEHTDVRGDPVSFKMSVNGRETSATFAPASLLYYHFARYFDSDAFVPVAVYRSMDRQVHFERVVARGLAASSRSELSPMNHAGWKLLAAGAADPSSYRPTNELYTADRSQVFGVLLHPAGRRFGPEINGTRESGWGEGQNRDFQETAPFLALRIDEPLQDAIAAGIAEARRNPKLAEAMDPQLTATQVAFWMKELTETVILDYVFSQQDRVGNIDFLEYWYWVDGGEVQRVPDISGRAPPDVAQGNPLKLRRIVLNDNDAGGRVNYANFAKRTGMLEGWHHMAPSTYRRLVALNRDFVAKGDVYRWLEASFGLTRQEIQQVVKNTALATSILEQACRNGQLRFDLDPAALLSGHGPEPDDVACEGS